MKTGLGTPRTAVREAPSEREEVTSQGGLIRLPGILGKQRKGFASQDGALSLEGRKSLLFFSVTL